MGSMSQGRGQRQLPPEEDPGLQTTPREGRKGWGLGDLVGASFCSFFTATRFYRRASTC